MRFSPAFYKGAFKPFLPLGLYIPRGGAWSHPEAYLSISLPWALAVHGISSVAAAAIFASPNSVLGAGAPVSPLTMCGRTRKII